MKESIWQELVLCRAAYVARNQSKCIILGHKSVWEGRPVISKPYLCAQNIIEGKQGFMVLVPKPSNGNMVQNMICLKR